MSLRKQWERIQRPESRYRAEVTAQHADGTSTVQTSDGRVSRVRNRPGLNVPVGSFAIITTSRRQGEKPSILRSAPTLQLSVFDNL